MLKRWMLFVFITLCMIGGLLAGAFSHSIEAALTVQKINGAQQNDGGAPAPVTSGKAGAPTATPMPVNVVALAQDNFQRATQTFWGKASDGRLWAGDANSIEIFSITNKAGQIDHGQGAFNAVLGPAITSADITFSGSVNHFVKDTVNMGAVLRWSDANNWYKALIDGSQLQILSKVKGGAIKVLATMPFNAKDGVTYTLRFRALGAALSVKAWQSSQPEPANWMLTVNDTALTKGMGGIRVLLQSTSVIRIMSFIETNVGMTA